MKKLVTILFLVFILTASLSAATNMFNIGYSVGPYGFVDNRVNRDLSMSWIRKGGNFVGLYSRLTPYYSISYNNQENGNVAIYFNLREVSIGTEGLLGVGWDLNVGRVGLLVGCGGYADYNFYSDLLGGPVSLLSLGAGAGTHVYYQPEGGTFLVNIGFSFAWKPYCIAITAAKSAWDFMPGRFDTMFDVGFGFRMN